MPAPIKVTARFAAEFEEYCRLSGLNQCREDMEAARKAIREDPAGGQEWVRRWLWVYRYCFSKWGRLPTVDECRAVLGPEADPGWFKREGILILAARCARSEGFKQE